MANVDLSVRTSGIENLDLSGVAPYDTPIWDQLLAEMVPEDQRKEFPFDHSTDVDQIQWPFDQRDDDDRVKGHGSDDDGRDERDSSPDDEDAPTEEG
jgi:hypothetical protein